MEQQWLRRQAGLTEIAASPALMYPFDDYRWDAWVVPCHAGDCHGQLDKYSDALAAMLFGSFDAPRDKIESVATECFNRGDYALAVRLRQFRRHRAIDQIEKQHHFQFELVAAAGLWFYRVPHPSRFTSALPDHLIADPLANPEYHLFLANQFACRYGQEVEGFLREWVDRVPNVRGSTLDAKKSRVLATATMRDVDIRAALAKMPDAGMGQHAIATTRIAAVIAAVADEQLTKAENGLPACHVSNGTASLWHEALRLFALGSVAYLTGHLFPALEYFVSAQYINVMKGFRGWTLPDITQPMRLRSERITPGYIVGRLVELHAVPADRMREVRLQALRHSGLAERLRQVPEYTWQPRGSDTGESPRHAV